MKVQCPNCGSNVTVNGLGRKPFNMPLINICDAIKAHHSVAQAAQELGCSPAYIFKVLKENGLKFKDLAES